MEKFSAGPKWCISGVVLHIFLAWSYLKLGATQMWGWSSQK